MARFQLGNQIVEAPDDATPEELDAILSPAKAAPTLTEGLFPRASKAKSLAGKVGGGALDAMADLFKVPVAAAGVIGSKVAPSPEPGFNTVPPGLTMASALGSLNAGTDYYGRHSLGARMAASPSTVPSLVSGMGAGGLIEGAIPGLAASMGGRLGAAAGAGLIQGGVSGLANQADAASQGRGFSAKGADKEALQTAAAAALLGGAGEAAKGVGKQIVKSFLKPGYTGVKEGFDIDNVFKNNLGGTVSQMVKKTSDALKGLQAEQEVAVNKNANVPVNVGAVAKDLVGDLNNQLGMGKLFGDEGDVRAALGKYGAALARHADANGNVPLAIAWEIKKKAAADASMLYKASRFGSSTDAMAKEKVAALFAKKLGDAIGDAAPDVTAMNPQFTEIIPIAKVLARRNIIAGQHNPIGLDDLAALDAGTQFATHGDMAGLLLPFLTRATKSPGVGNALVRGGGKLLYQGSEGVGGMIPRTLAGMTVGATR